MQEKEILESLKQMRESSKQRNFEQSIEFIVNFKGIDFKKADNQIDEKVSLPFSTGKSSGKTLVFVKDKEFASQLEGKIDKIMMEQEIEKISKKDAQILSTDYDLLLAEGPVMVTVGKFLGQVLAPKGKMPKPVTKNMAEVERMIKTAGTTTRITNKKGKFMPIIQVVIGKESMEDEQMSKNALAIYNSLIGAIPSRHNIKSIYIKTTMGSPVKIGAKRNDKKGVAK